MNTIKPELFGNDAKANKILSFAGNVAVTKAPLLIVGEHGTGKRSLGTYIHQLSSRANGNLIVVDCSEDKQTVENNILGYRDDESGRFHKGALENGNSGTVIFANIDGLDEDFQRRLYQILNELADYDIDIRIVATTTKNLSKLVGSGRFYRALYTYVSGTQITLTALRDRIEDLQHLSSYMIQELSPSFEFDTISIDNLAMDKMLAHYWTYNMEELKNVLIESLKNSEDGIINLDNLALGDRKVASAINDNDDDGIKLMSLKEAEKLLIKKALIHTSENRTQAAKILGVSIRTLRNKINEYRSDGSQFFLNLR